jgi:hypothetical protein
MFPAFLPLLLGSLFAAGLGGVAWWKLSPNNPNKDTVNQSNNAPVSEPEEELPQTAAKQEQPLTHSSVEPTKPVAPAASPQSGTVDLLPLIDPAKHTFRGLWKKTDGVLSVVSPSGVNESVGAALHIDYRPKGAYTLTLRARRSRNGGLIVPLVFSGRQFGAYLSGGWSGSSIPEARPMTVYPADFFPTTDWHKVTVDVGRDRIRCVGDSGAKLEWQADYALIEGRPFDMPDPLSLYLKAWGEFEIDTLMIAEHE